MGHVLIVEDDADAAQVFAALVARDGHTVVTVPSLREARAVISAQPPQLLLLDLHLPDGSGLELFDPPGLLGDIEVVLLTGQASLETSIKALRLGAADYLVKPLNPQHLHALLGRLMPPSKLRAEVAEMNDQLRETGRFGPLIGTSAAMQAVYRQIARVAATAVTVFIHGESGTGKELVARAVHDLGRRRESAFLAVNCGAISPHLIESEIFGHERGSFTGADRQHHGFFERAHGGTLFLDEVTEMPPTLQVKLLRVLETGTFMRVGSSQMQRTDVRIIAATNRDAAEAVVHGALREDLLYRLNVFPIALPPLRERLDDVPLLARSFLDELGRKEKSAKKFSSHAIERLCHYSWPGNVRELRNVVQRAWVMAHGETIDHEWLPTTSMGRPLAGEAALVLGAPRGELAVESSANLTAKTDAGADVDQLVIPLGISLAEVERQVILTTFERCGRHKERTAAVLGISMKTLYNRLKEYRV